MLAGDGEPRVGAPFIEGASVAGKIVEQKRGPKVIAFKKRRRQNSKRKRGHRQDLTLVRITSLGAAAAAPRGLSRKAERDLLDALEEPAAPATVEA